MTDHPIRVMVVADHDILRNLLIFRLAHEPGVLVVGHAGTVSAARAALRQTLIGPGVDVVTVDLGLPDGAAGDLIRDIHALVSDAAVLAIAAHDDPESLALAVEAGAAGLIQREETPEHIVAAIRTLGAGQPLLTPAEVRHWLRLAAEVRDRDRVALAAIHSLSPREREVLQVLAAGHSDLDLVEVLGISYDTVRSHMANILGKLGVDSRLQAVIFAARYGAITIR